MKKKRKIFFIFSILGVLIVLCLLFFTRSPIGRALLKSKSHFILHADDSRILYEPGAEEFADRIADFLPVAIERVEKGHFHPFKKPFKVYICSTQESHNAFIAIPPSYPIRGTALQGNVFIAPSAFSFKNMDTHRESLMHELSHLHLSQRLGIFKSRKIPYWFTEGLANIISGAGGEGISKEMAIQSIQEGRHLILQEKGRFFKSLTKIIEEAGLTGPMFHKQNKMFVHYLNNTNPEAFKKLVLAIQNGERFSKSFISHFKMNPQQMWNQFKVELLSTRNEDKSSNIYN